MASGQTGVRYKIGIDVGDRSVGLAFVEFDERDMPINLLRAVTYRHDGGVDPSTGKTPQSRKATAGVARRVRRLRRVRTKRLNKLDYELNQLGFPVLDVSGNSDSPGETYAAWEARARAVEGYIEDRDERLEAVSRAARHIARHRGWKNPWWSFERLAQEPTPSENHLTNVANARELIRMTLPTHPTLGQIATAASEFNHVIRPRSEENRVASPIISAKVLQSDELAELRSILQVQQVDHEAAERIMRTVFEQKRPYVPVANVGKDELPGMEKYLRASTATLAFQEFRIRATVANLRIRVRAGSTKSTKPEPETLASIAQFLLSWDEKEPPTWTDVAEYISLDPALLVTPTFEDSLVQRAPYDRSSATIRKKFAKKTAQVRDWWNSADTEEREIFIALISDPTETAQDDADASGFSDVFTSWSEDARDEFTDLKLESGRAAYSKESLQRLNAEMASGELDLQAARKAAFGVDDSWKPKPPSIETATGQPTVDRVLTIVRRGLMGAVKRWGVPEAVYVEHVRAGLIGPEARNKLQSEIRINRRQRENQIRMLEEQGVDSPRISDIQRHVTIQRQGGLCAYCGTNILSNNLTGVELDHIVPRSGGGSNRRDNLVAVCRPCNAEKGKLPFAVFAQQSSNTEITVEKVLQRAKLWVWTRAEERVKRAMMQRFRRVEADPEIDERSMASTAYAAVAVRQRITSYLDEQAEKLGAASAAVEVYEGAVTREARRAGQIDGLIRLRGKEDKDRFDVRHHAIDAAVMTLLNPSIAMTLRERTNLRNAEHYTGDEPEWREYQGRSETARSKYELWRRQSYALADLLGAAIKADEIPVVSPLRLSERRGSVHKDTVEKLEYSQLLGDAWNEKHIKRICDPEVYLAVVALVDAKGNLPADPDRTITVHGKKYVGSDVIECFKVAAASIRVKGGSVAIGESIHHARIYAWKDRKGEIRFGMQRVFTAELPWFRKISGIQDSFTVPIHPGSMSYRDLQPGVQKAIESMGAKPIGWIVENDELEIDISEHALDHTSFGVFLESYPEKTWRVDGFYDERRLRIRPSRLAREGLSPEASQTVSQTLEKGEAVSVSKLFSEELKVNRRDALGDLRLQGKTGLPVSWQAGRAAKQILS